MITDVLILIWFCNFAPIDEDARLNDLNNRNYVYLPQIVTIVIVEPM